MASSIFRMQCFEEPYYVVSDRDANPMDHKMAIDFILHYSLQFTAERMFMELAEESVILHHNDGIAIRNSPHVFPSANSSPNQMYIRQHQTYRPEVLLTKPLPGKWNCLCTTAGNQVSQFMIIATS